MASHSPCFALLALLAAACSADNSAKTAAAQATPAQQQPAGSEAFIPTSHPVLLDSSDYVMYPLLLSEISKESRDEYGSSYSSRQESFWNIAFYNAKTGASHLLSEHRQVLIQAYKTTSYDSSTGSASVDYPAFPAANELLYFSVITTDYDHDGQLTEHDPTYLFTSNKAGTSFTQVSPDSMHLANWEIQKATGKLFMQVQADSNHDRKFGEEDATIPYVYDLKSRRPATPVFGAAAVKNMRAQFQRQWAPKPGQPK